MKIRAKKIKPRLKKILCVLLTLSMFILSISFTTSAEVVQEEKTGVVVDVESEYRINDKITGHILEFYDNLINGENNTNYADLATSMSTSKVYRVQAMNFIIEIYDKAKSEERLHLATYIQNYAPYSGEENLIEFLNQLMANTTTTYDILNRTAAVEYANTYYVNYNPNYPNLHYLGGDCTNFASQCLVAGGKVMDDAWRCVRRNNIYNTPASVAQLEESWSITNSWMNSSSFDSYWAVNGREVYQCLVAEYASDPFEYFLLPIYEGDIIQLQKPFLWWYEAEHTMVIVGYNEDRGDFIYAAHTNSTNSSTILNNVCGNSYYDDYLIKFFHM